MVPMVKVTQHLVPQIFTDNDWLFGDSRADVTESVQYGRQGVMPAWSNILGDDKVHLVGAYVWSLSNQPQPEPVQ